MGQRVRAEHDDQSWHAGFGENLKWVEKCARLNSITIYATTPLRGRNQFYLNNFNESRIDFSENAQERTGTGRVYPLLCAVIADSRVGKNVRQSLRDLNSVAEGDTRPVPILAHFLGEKAESEVMRLATNAKTDSGKREQQREANFFLGQLRLAEGNKSAAIKHFDQLNGPYASIAYFTVATVPRAKRASPR